MNLLLVNDTSASLNLGCRVTMHMLDRLLARVYPDAAIERVPMSTAAYRFSPEQRASLLPGPSTSLDQAAAHILASDVGPVREAVAALRRADCVLVNGEGSFIEDIRPCLFLLAFCQAARHLRKPCHLLNFTAHLTLPHVVELARQVFAGCATVAVREPLSYYLVKRFHPPVKLFPDVVVALGREAPPTTPPRSSLAPLVLIGGGSATKRMNGQLESLVDGYRQLCRHLVARGSEVQALIWPHDEWLRALEGPAVQSRPVDFLEYFQMCRAATVNLTGRHHGNVMSAAAGCPFVTTTANSLKNFGDRLLYGSAGPVLEMERFSAAPAAAAIDGVLADAPRHRGAMEARRDALAPFAEAAIVNTRTPVADLVEAELVPAEVPEAELRFIQAPR